MKLSTSKGMKTKTKVRFGFLLFGFIRFSSVVKPRQKHTKCRTIPDAREHPPVERWVFFFLLTSLANDHERTLSGGVLSPSA